MEKLNILLVCGGGASSGFLASNMRKEATNQSLDLEINARSESEIDDYKDDLDVLLIGPHLRYLEDEIKDNLSDTQIKIAVISDEAYGMLDGKKALEEALALVK